MADDVRTGGLPYVDEHSITIAAPRDRVWAALRRYADSLTTSANPPLSWLLGTDPPGGFAVTQVVPNERLVLSGGHRFSRYQLAFDLATAEGDTTVTARTHAAFPGPHGFAYRTLVIGSRGHAAAVHRMLRSIHHAALRPERDG